MNAPNSFKKKTLWPFFYGWGSTASRLQSHFEEAVYFYHQVPRKFWYSFDRTLKDKRLSQTWSNPVVLNTGPQDWESSTLTTIAIPFKIWKNSDIFYIFFNKLDFLIISHKAIFLSKIFHSPLLTTFVPFLRSLPIL